MMEVKKYALSYLYSSLPRYDKVELDEKTRTVSYYRTTEGVSIKVFEYVYDPDYTTSFGETLGIEIVEALSAEEAIKTFREWFPNMILQIKAKEILR